MAASAGVVGRVPFRSHLQGVLLRPHPRACFSQTSAAAERVLGSVASAGRLTGCSSTLGFGSREGSGEGRRGRVAEDYRRGCTLGNCKRGVLWCGAADRAGWVSHSRQLSSLGGRSSGSCRSFSGVQATAGRGRKKSAGHVSARPETQACSSANGTPQTDSDEVEDKSLAKLSAAAAISPNSNDLASSASPSPSPSPSPSSSSSTATIPPMPLPPLIESIPPPGLSTPSPPSPLAPMTPDGYYDYAEDYALNAAAVDAVLDAVVKVFVVSTAPNNFLPWQNKPQRESTGSGFIVEGRRVLTNAHVVAEATFVAIRKHGSGTKYRASVEAVGHECDLAVLRVEDEEFWQDDVQPLKFGSIPQLQDSVSVVGYPTGGDNISVTRGVVSRVELTSYVHGATTLLAVQLDAAINPGNSGGPALLDGQVIGVAFQNLPGADSIGYIIPPNIVAHFLEDIKRNDGKFVGFCSLGISCQPLENPSLRSYLKMKPGQTGVLINSIHPLGSARNLLRKNDVLLAFDGCPIAFDGTVQFRGRNERIAFDFLISSKPAGSKAQLSILRDGEEQLLEVELRPLKNLVPPHQHDMNPSYYIYAGLVFTPLTQPYLMEYGSEWYNTSPRKLCDKALTALPSSSDEQVVILSQVLLDDVNAGYQQMAELQLKQINGVPVRNLKHLRYLVETAEGPFIRFDLDDDRVVVLEMEAAKVASERILKQHRIRSSASDDVIGDLALKEGEAILALPTSKPDKVTESSAS